MTIPLPTTESPAPPDDLTILQFGWLMVVQLGVLALAFTALRWAGPPPPTQQALLGVLALACLLVAITPPWRRGAVAGIVTGTLLAVVCWMAVSVPDSESLRIITLLGTEIPLLVPVVLGAAVLLVVMGVIARIGLADTSRFGVAAVAGAVLLVAVAIFLYSVINRTPAFHDRYSIAPYQLVQLLAAMLLYPLALWLGSTGLRPAGGWRVLPFCLALLISGFLICWRS